MPKPRPTMCQTKITAQCRPTKLHMVRNLLDRLDTR